MSARHPIIAITGSSGAGTTTVTTTFQQIFRREGIRAAIVHGDAFHRYDRNEMRVQRAKAQNNGQMHFSLVEDDPTKPADHVLPYDEVDIQKTIYVNTRRGFRIVFRDKPWQQYLKDHPDSTPSDVPPPQTK